MDEHVTIESLKRRAGLICERCKLNVMACVGPDTPEEALELPSYGVPPWCDDCLEVYDWGNHWMEQAKKQYQSGERQS